MYRPREFIAVRGGYTDDYKEPTKSRSILDLAGGDVDHQLGGLAEVSRALFAGDIGHHGPLPSGISREAE
jgi:hypothetical protein